MIKQGSHQYLQRKFKERMRCTSAAGGYLNRAHRRTSGLRGFCVVVQARRPHGFWDNNDNYGRYAAWLAAELQTMEPSAWYRLTVKMVTVRQNGGAGLLNLYDGNPQQFVEQVVHLHPDHEWIPWLFDGDVPQSFWDYIDNHGRYAAWLAAELQLAGWSQTTSTSSQ